MDPHPEAEMLCIAVLAISLYHRTATRVGCPCGYTLELAGLFSF